MWQKVLMMDGRLLSQIIWLEARRLERKFFDAIPLGNNDSLTRFQTSLAAVPRTQPYIHFSHLQCWLRVGC